jgi:pantetheine-phosphate adenylyltransferase
MLQKITSSFSNVSVDNFESQFLVDYAKSVKADYILRGIRTERDFVHECGIRHINSDLSPEVTTVFLIPPREIVEVSSSFVKELVGPEGWQEVIKKYVPGPVHKKFLEKFAAATK